jgi:phage terminase large subunit
LPYYLNLLRQRGLDKAYCILPHDGVNANNYTGKQFKDHLTDAGFTVDVIPNQGKGAAMMRVEALRRVFPQIRFNAPTTEAGRLALGYYHEKRDDVRDVGLGPEHDWSSNSADALGLMAIHYEDPNRYANRPMQIQAADDLNPAGVFVRGGRWDATRFGDAIEE